MLIQCDFDGTITRNNLSVLLRENFASGDWRKIESAYSQRRVTVEQSNALQYLLIKEPKERLQEFVCQHIEMRPGFSEFIAYCRQSGIPFVIVSSGLDFYIEPVLAWNGMSDLELHCGHTIFGEDGIAVYYTDPEGNTIDSGFKSRHLAWLRQRDRTIVYLGDGYSDLEAARHADHILATGELQSLLRAESVAFSSFDDFHDVLRQVRLLC